MFAFYIQFVTQTQDNVSGFMPSLFVSIFCAFLHIFMLIFWQEAGERGVSCFALRAPRPQA